MLGKINKNYLLKVKKLSKVFEIRDAALRKRTIKAVDSVSFGINKKENFEGKHHLYVSYNIKEDFKNRKKKIS